MNAASCVGGLFVATHIANSTILALPHVMTQHVIFKFTARIGQQVRASLVREPVILIINFIVKDVAEPCARSSTAAVAANSAARVVHEASADSRGVVRSSRPLALLIVALTVLTSV